MKSRNNPAPAVFLDRDGTLSEEVNYLSDPANLKLLPGVVEAARKLAEAGFKLFVVTNQSGVARGYLDIPTLDKIHEKLHSLMKEGGTRVDHIYYCPHHPTAGTGEYARVCSCRKPAPGMILQAACEYDVDLSRSYVIGDKLTDIQMARDLQAHAILVKTGYGEGEMNYLLKELIDYPDHIADDLGKAVRWILEHDVDHWDAKR